MSNIIDNQLAKDTWEKIGHWWDEEMQEGDIFHSYLIHPHIINLLELKPEDELIDLACGNGGLTRKIAKILGKPIYGLDFSSTLLERAKTRDRAAGFNNKFSLGDLMQTNALRAYSDKNINKAVCSMAVHDIEDIKPLIASVKQLLPQNGVFIISTLHSCFNSGEVGLQADVGKDKKLGIVRNTYVNPVRLLSNGKDNQPLPHPFFHRPLSLLLQEFFNEGFVLDKCMEPVFSNEDIATIGQDYLWCKLPEIPPVILLRFVLK